MSELSQRKRVRDDSSEFNTESPYNSKKIREDLLSLLDDSDLIPDRDSPSQDLDSVIRSFEEAISPAPEPASFVDLTSDVPGETELVRNSAESEGIGELWDELPSCDSFELGMVGDVDERHEYVALDGVFDYSDLDFGSEFTWRPETLPAL